PVWRKACPARRPRTERIDRIGLSSGFLLVAQNGQNLGGEALELGELIVAHESDTQIADPGRPVPLERSDHAVGRAEAHRPPRVHAAAVTGREGLRAD